MKQKPRYITLPETWDELTQDDWREILRMRQTVATTDHVWTIRDVRIQTACTLLKNRGVKMQVNNKQYLVLLSLLADTLDWLWKEDNGTLSLVYRSTLNLLPGIGKNGKKDGKSVYKWIGPLSHGSDLTFGEFRQALTVLKNYETRMSVRDLDVLAGLLYRPEATEQQRHEQQLRRIPYDWDTFGQKEIRGQKMERWQVWGIYAWFAYFCEYLTTGTFLIDGSEVTFAPLFAGDDTEDVSCDSSGNSMLRICLTLAESQVFGTAHDVDHTPLLTVMLKLLQDYETLMRLKKTYNKKTK